jgi:hypothetical protein
MRFRTPRVLALSLLTILVLGSLSAPARAAEPDPTPPLDGATAAAKEALATVRGLLDGITGPLQATGDSHDDLTLALRDLALLKNDLPAADQRAAERLLARPTDGAGDQFGDGYEVPEQTPVCSDVVCVHYVLEPALPGSQTQHEVNPADGPDEGTVPDYVDFAVKTMTDVHNAYVAGGYRAPKADSILGGDSKPDIYLANVGDDGFYGYCASDDPSASRNAWAYCVLDNDYVASEFGTRNTPAQNFKVTAAHEYFHAVQFGYDVAEDGWVMEATATWAEDQLYDGVNDNRQYLPHGPMKLPHESLDQFTGAFHYGTWIFFRYLTERFPAAQGQLPILVRDLWRRLDQSAGRPGEYSLQGLKKVLRQRNMSLTKAFAGFSAANRRPGLAYEEGKAYPSAPLAALKTLGKDRRRTGPLPLSLDHLAAGTVRYTPDRSLGGSAWRVRLILEMKPRWKGSGAIVTIKPQSGKPRAKWVSLNRLGDAKPMANFSRSTTKWVEVTLVNASDHFRCWRGTRFSCRGVPKFDDSVERISAKIYKAN